MFYSTNSFDNHCRICNDYASGIHFGVLTCEACKAFYRRMSTSLTIISLPCSPNRCIININNRNNCPSCRYDKCKRLGMDRNNIIYGKQSKKDKNSFHNYLEIFNELIEIFQNISTIEYQTLIIEQFTKRIISIFYSETNSFISNGYNIMLKLFYFVFHSNKINYNRNIRMILLIWLFVYYNETFIFKKNLNENHLIILKKFLNIEYNENHLFIIDFLNTFTKLTDHIDEIY